MAWNSSRTGREGVYTPQRTEPVVVSAGEGAVAGSGSENLLERKLRETVARGYCDDRNCTKVLDVDLLNSIVNEIMLALSPTCHPERRLPLALMSSLIK